MKQLFSSRAVSVLVGLLLLLSSVALFSTLAEAARPTKWRVEFDELGVLLHVDEKVGPDHLRMGAAAPRLAVGLDNLSAQERTRTRL